MSLKDLGVGLDRGQYPWISVPHLVTSGFARFLSEQQSPKYRPLLPENIELIICEDVDHKEIEFFISGMISQIKRELPMWAERLSLASEYDRDSSFVAKAIRVAKGRQQWLILHSVEGGFGISEKGALGEIVTCSTKQHHGVAWWQLPSASSSHALITSRDIGADWNWDSDIGHEAAHAAFAPVPLFTQNIERRSRLVRLRINAACSANSLTEVQVSRLIYMASEILNVAVRGEQRFVGTGLPGIGDIAEFHEWLSVIESLAPSLGFDRARKVVEGIQYFLVGNDSRILSLVSPLLRFFSKLDDFCGAERPPSVSELRLNLSHRNW